MMREANVLTKVNEIWKESGLWGTLLSSCSNEALTLNTVLNDRDIYY